MAYESAILIWLVGALAGSMLFFAFTVAPSVFRTLSAEQAGLFLRAFFPTYYLWGLIVALIAAVLAMTTNATLSVACFLVALLFVFAEQLNNYKQLWTPIKTIMDTHKTIMDTHKSN